MYMCMFMYVYIFSALFTLLFGYIGQFMHNGIILTLGSFVMAVGSFIMVLPQILSGEYELGPQPVEICDLGSSTYLPYVNPHIFLFQIYLLTPRFNV